jgi:hypothetical protein
MWVLIIRKAYEQQVKMYENNENKVELLKANLVKQKEDLASIGL